jgi:triacylglycerol lipase
VAVTVRAPSIDVRSHSIILDGIWGRPHRWEPLRAALEARVGPAEIFYYDSSGKPTFEKLATQLIDRVRAIDQPVNLIGYSMGGIVVRTACLLAPDLPVRRAALLNAPHAGSLLAWLLPFPGVRQLRPNSELLRKLKTQPWDIPTLVVSNPLDTAVVPPSSTKWAVERGSYSVCSVPIHVWPIFSRGLRERIVRFVAAEQIGNDDQQPASNPV